MKKRHFSAEQHRHAGTGPVARYFNWDKWDKSPLSMHAKGNTSDPVLSGQFYYICCEESVFLRYVYLTITNYVVLKSSGRRGPHCSFLGFIKVKVETGPV